MILYPSRLGGVHVLTCKSSARHKVENASKADSRNDPLSSHKLFSFARRACITAVYA